MKRIGIDARLYFQTGVGVYLRNFLHYLSQMNLSDYEFYIYVLKKDSPQITFSSNNFIKKEVQSHWHSLSEQTTFYSILKRDDLDLMHFTYFSYPILYKKPFIATVHDITPLVHKTGKASTLHPWLYEIKYQSFKYVLQKQVQNSARIITPTHTVKKQLASLYGKKYEDKMQPIYEGVNYEILEAKENIELSQKYTKPFFLYVGNFYPHKNVDTLVESFKQVPNNIDLVLVGPNNYFSGTIEKMIEERAQKNIKMVHTGSIEDLVFFYKHALALINPSISEGFGLPLIEAAHFNLPIIASDLEVFHELFGDNFVSFNPQDAGDISQKLLQFLNQKPHFNFSDIQKKYSFKKMTEEIIAIYNKQLLATS